MKNQNEELYRCALPTEPDTSNGWFCIIGDHHPGYDFSGFHPAPLNERNREQALRIISMRGWSAENCLFWMDGHCNTLVTLNQEVV